MHAVLRTVAHIQLSLHVWVAVPCTAGCTWKFANDALGAASSAVTAASAAASAESDKFFAPTIQSDAVWGDTTHDAPASAVTASGEVASAESDKVSAPRRQ